MAASDKKLYLGGRLRRLRRELALTQSRMAEDLGVSASYLNLIERNQRPVTAQMLLRLAEAYDLDLRALTQEDSGGAAGVEEVFADPLFADLGVSRHEVAEMAETAPTVAEAVVRLYRTYLDRSRVMDLATLDDRGAPRAVAEPSDWVRDYLQGRMNYFGELEEGASELVQAMEIGPAGVGEAARLRLAQAYRIETRIMPVEVMRDTLRRYDHHRKRLMLSEALSPHGRTFAILYHLGMFEHRERLDALVERASPPDRTTRSLLRLSFANYLAAAAMMPYEAFHALVEETGYDLGRVKARFGASYEQICHRLTTLGRPGARGVPFFMLRVDPAGNISKRFSSGAFPFSRFGGACPRWNIHASFRTPGKIITQVIETPDGQRYFTLSCTVPRAASSDVGELGELAIGLGCELKYAGKLIYSRGLDIARPAAVEVGPSCRTCERPACPERAATPISRTMLVDDFAKSVSPFPFAP